MDLKKCINCFKSKLFIDFYPKKKTYPTKLQSWCKACHNEVHKAWRESKRRNILSKWLRSSAKVVTLLFCTYFVTACATTITPITKSHFDDPLNRSDNTHVMDQHRCGSWNGMVNNKDISFYNACMGEKGYKLVTTTENVESRSFLGILPLVD